MKRYLCCILIALLIITSTGCRSNSDNFKEPVNFYYTSATVSFFESDSVIASEVRETADYKGNILDTLNSYLRGPVSDKLTSPFPVELKVISTEQKDNTIIILFNKQFSSLTGLNLTIACSCICATVVELTGCETVEFKSEGPLPDSVPSLVFSCDNLLLRDSVE